MSVELNAMAAEGKCFFFTFFKPLFHDLTCFLAGMLQSAVKEEKQKSCLTFFFILSSPSFSPQYAVVQSGLARGLWLSAWGQWTKLYPVGGGGQQRPPGGVAGRGPGPGDRGSQCVNAGSPSRHCYRPDSEEHSSQYRSRVPHTAGPAPFQSIACNGAHVV